ncbi:hypothetical protein TNCV_4206421 [Trichonephila clavipes]|nr:hypothetical protein TNCV_4206421 [Trichonephila clavipes]
MTINKSQGQTMTICGLDLESPCFSHGQLYVACPRYLSSGTFSCLLLPTISNGTLRTIHLASNTARRPACSFHPDDQASLKLA